MENYKSRIGKSQMKQYMGEMYEDPMVVYREYIQNACDAIEDALKEGLLQDRKKSTIIVRIDTYNRNITFEDKGIGIKGENIAPYLVDVASSQKIGRAGQYGIGRLNGALYCDKIKYETSYSGEDFKSTLVWDVKRAKEICDNPNENPTTEEIIDTVTYLLPAESEDVDKHYCRVTLENVNNDTLLDQDKVIDYIAQIVPVDYSLDFKDNLLKPSLEEESNSAYKNRFKDLWIYKISVNDIPVEKKYASEIDGFKFGSIKCFSLKDSKTQEEYAWGWYAMNLEAKQMNDLPISFIRVRHCNYQLGHRNKQLPELYKKTIDQAYFIGEMHLVHKDILPSASRDGIKQNDTKTLFYMVVKKFFEELTTLYNKTSKFRSDVVEKIAEANIQIASLSQSLKKEDDPEEKQKIKDKIKKHKEDKANAENKAKTFVDFFVKTGSWNSATDIVDSVNGSKIKAYNQKDEVVKGDLQVQSLKVDSFKPREIVSSEDIEQPHQPDDNTTNPQTSNDKPTEPEQEKPASELDDYKGLSKTERDLIKKFYGVINKVDLPEKTKEKIKKSLKKTILK